MVCDQKITSVQTALALFLRKYRKASYREIARGCGISKSSAPRICRDNPPPNKDASKSSNKGGRPQKVNGRRLPVLVAIAYGKGIILTVPYEKMHGSFFTQFIRSHFNIAFGRAELKRNARQLFVMDNDPSQTSKHVKEVLEEIEAELLKCPPYCADIHCIEYLFNQIKCHLDEEAVTQNITKESFEQFTTQVLRAFDDFPIEDIDKLILSMTHRIEAVLASKGRKTKY